MSVFLILLIIIISFAIFAFGVFYLTARWRRQTLWVCFIFVIIGFSLYTVSYLSSGTALPDTLYAALRGIFSTVRMFSVNDDHWVLMDIQGTQWLTENMWIQVIFWLCHVSALMIVFQTGLMLFGRKQINKFRMRFGPHNEVYIIRGSSKYALLLGKNIAANDSLQEAVDINRLVMFLVNEDDELKKVQEKTLHFNGVVNVINEKNDLLHYFKITGLGKRRRHKAKYHLLLMSDCISVPNETLLVAEYAKNINLHEDILHIYSFLSSEWDREQIESFTQNEINDYPCTFHLIREDDLFVRQMVNKHPPFKCAGLGFNDIGVAKRSFNVMILGFGTVGQQALLHLIMNGQFDTQDGSVMRAIVVDREISHIKEHFEHCYPSLPLCCEVEYLNYDVRGKEFFNFLKDNKKIGCVDYIVISLNSNEENKLIALDIRLQYTRNGLETLPFIAISEKNTEIHKTEHKDDYIFTFGCREEIYKDAVIIRDEPNRVAKAVHTVYGGEPPWHKLDWIRQESNRAVADFIPTMLYLAGFTGDKQVDFQNIDAAHLEILAQTEQLRWIAFHVVMGYRNISIDEMQKRFERYKNEINPLDFARRDYKEKLQVCLVPWDDLDKISEAYRELAERINNEKEKTRDFKENDRRNVKNIPEFLRVAKGGK